MKRITVLVCSAFLSVALLYGVAHADKTADEYLAKVDAMLQPGKDMTAVSKTVLISKDGKTEERKMKVYRKGKKKVFFFIAPPGVKGVAFLSLSDDQMYLYLPAFKKVRRIASSAKNENFMGTDMSYDDMAQTSLAEKYTPKVIKDSKDEVVMELTAKPGSDAIYSKMIITVDKKIWLRKKAEMYDKAGRLWKTMKAENIKVINGYPTPMIIEIKDVNTGHATRIEIEEIKYDTGLSDSIFSKRKLRRIK